MAGEQALPLFNSMLEYLRKNYTADRVFPGAFGEYMNVEIVGDGPVTIVIDSIRDEKALKKLEKQKEREEKQAARKQDIAKEVEEKLKVKEEEEEKK